MFSDYKIIDNFKGNKYLPKPLEIRGQGSTSWRKVFSSRSLRFLNASEVFWKRALKKSANQIIWRQCLDCKGVYRNIYYRRITPWGRINVRDLFLKSWKSRPNGGSNILNKDFELYSTYRDAKKRRNKWRACNYDDIKAGFPRDCGVKKLNPPIIKRIGRSKTSNVGGSKGGSKGGSSKGGRRKGGSKGGSSKGGRRRGGSKGRVRIIRISKEARMLGDKRSKNKRWRFYIEELINCAASFNTDYPANNQGNTKLITQGRIPKIHICRYTKPVCKGYIANKKWGRCKKASPEDKKKIINDQLQSNTVNMATTTVSRKTENFTNFTQISEDRLKKNIIPVDLFNRSEITYKDNLKHIEDQENLKILLDNELSELNKKISKIEKNNNSLDDKLFVNKRKFIFDEDSYKNKNFVFNIIILILSILFITLSIGIVYKKVLN